MAFADEALAVKVRDTLAQDRRISGLTVVVRAAGGDIFVKGRVDTVEQSELIQMVCRGVSGVRRVVLDELEVTEAGS